MKNVNLNVAKEKGLITDNNLLYEKVVYEYKYLFEYFLSSIVDFKKYEDNINNANINIIKSNECQGSNEFLNLDYLRLVNNLYIEKLEKKDIDLILKNFDKNSITNDFLDIVKRTYREVIKDNYFKGEYTNQAYKVCYGNIIPSNFVDNDSLVFIFYYSSNPINCSNKNDFIKLKKEQINYIKSEMDLLKKEIIDKLNIKVEILIREDIY